MKQLNRIIYLIIEALCIAWILGGSFWVAKNISICEARTDFFTIQIPIIGVLFVVISIIPLLPSKFLWNWGPRFDKDNLDLKSKEKNSIKVKTIKTKFSPDPEKYRMLSFSVLQLVNMIICTIGTIDMFYPDLLNMVWCIIIPIFSVIVWCIVSVLIERKLEKQNRISK